MHRHHGTLRLFIKIISLVLIGVAAYIALRYGLAHPRSGDTSPVGTSTSTVTTATSTQSPPTTPDLSWEHGMTVITQKNDHSIVSLFKNERFVIQLGTDVNWKFSFDPVDGITRVPNTTTANGIQGIYEANKIGTTTLRATGSPICTPGAACPTFVLTTTITFVTK
ncbi:hypothetical protein H0X32_02015 [Patescibacteria group bacterium]|nr:hypothetical protein [Patescibacteria group bacterium]